MKTCFVILMSVAPLFAEAQSLLSAAGGYSFGSGDNGTSLSGWRINALYARVSENPKVQHGVSLGYVNVTGKNTSTILGVTNTEDLTFSTIPVFYAPKFLFGNSDTFKPYMRLAIGGHFSTLNRTTTFTTFKDNDIGFYGGASAGANLIFKSQMFMFAEYEWAWLSNSTYQDGFLHTVSLGVGKKF